MTRADYVIEGWKRMYVSGAWTLETFEHHVEAMLPTIPLEWYGERAPKPRRDVSALAMVYADAVRNGTYHLSSQESPNT